MFQKCSTVIRQSSGKTNRFGQIMDSNKSEQTKLTFKKKWDSLPNLAWKTTLDQNSEIHNWILNRNGFKDESEFKLFLEDKKTILDAGCGNGRVTSMISRNLKEFQNLFAIDLNLDAAKKNLLNTKNVELRVVDLDSPKEIANLPKFDFIYCQEVLHHLNQPKTTFESLARQLEIGGEIAIYVYGLKGPIREWADQYIHNRLVHENYDVVLQLLEQLVHFGEVLRKSNTTYEIPKVELLGIEAGHYTIHHLIYKHFIKCFFNNDLSLEENIQIMADWYLPAISIHYDLSEVMSWFSDMDLEITWKHVDDYGITIRGRKKF